MAPSLPLEIIELIIDIVAQNDRHEVPLRSEFHNIKSCALIHRTFLHQCRQHIFHSIKLYDNGRGSSSSRYKLTESFAQLITDKPAIAQYVRKLHYVLQPRITKLDPGSPIPASLVHLTNLEKLTLSPTCDFLDWDGMRSQSRSTLMLLLRNPKIRSLHLIRVDRFMVSDLIRCINLRKLDLDHVFVISETVDVASAILPASTIPLRYLGLKNMYPAEAARAVKRNLPDGRPILDMDTLKYISIRIMNRLDVELATEILQQTRDLEEIHLSVIKRLVDSEIETNSIFSLISPSLKTLNSLTIVLHPNDGSPGPLRGFFRLFELISGRNSIKNLKIFIRIPKHLDCSVGDEWGELERVLLDPGWACLARLNLTIIANSVREGRWLEKALRKLPETQLQGLVASKKVAFDFSASEGLPA